MSHGVCHFITWFVFAYSYDAIALLMSLSTKTTSVSSDHLCLSIWAASKLLEGGELALCITIPSGLLTAWTVGKPLLFRKVPVPYEVLCSVAAPRCGSATAPAPEGVTHWRMLQTKPQARGNRRGGMRALPGWGRGCRRARHGGKA